MFRVMLGVLFVIGMIGAYPVPSILVLVLCVLAFVAQRKWGPPPEQQLEALRTKQRLRVSPPPYKQWKQESLQEEDLIRRIAKRHAAKVAADQAQIRSREAIAQAEKDSVVTHDEVFNRLPEHLRKDF
jgi:protein-tyrosine-phosphatase